MTRILVQISFAANANLENVRNQLIELKNEDKYTFASCFLNREMVIEKEFDTKIVDLLEGILGVEYSTKADEYATFSDFMDNIMIARKELADEVNRLFVLDSGTASGVAKEIELFTNAKVILLP